MPRAEPSRSERLNLTLPAQFRRRLLEEARIMNEGLPRLVLSLAAEALLARARRRLETKLAQAYRELSGEHETLAREFESADADGLE